MAQFNLLDNTFTDDSWIDWFIWESLDTVHIFNNKDEPILMSDEYWNAQVLIPCVKLNQFKLHVPIERFGNRTKCIIIPLTDTPITVRTLLTTIFNFYDTPVINTDLDELDPNCDYVKDAYKNLCENKCVTWMDLIGSRSYFDTTLKSRRNPFHCCGLVRYEGINMIKVNNEYIFDLLLGS